MTVGGVSALNLLSGSDMTGQAMVNAMDNTGGDRGLGATNGTIGADNNAGGTVGGMIELSATNQFGADHHL